MSRVYVSLMETNTAAQSEKCPASGRTAKWCTDQTHLHCWSALAESVALDRKIEAVR
jgi:hypothetical protein